MFKIESPPLTLIEPAKLPTHQRMHFGIFVNGTFDSREEPGLLQGFHVLAKVPIISHKSSPAFLWNDFQLSIAFRPHGLSLVAHTSLLPRAFALEALPAPGDL